MRRLMPLLFVAAVAFAVPARAQEEEPPHLLPFEVHVGGGFTFALSNIRQYLGDGYHVNTGLTLPLTPVLGLQAEYSFNGIGKKTVTIPTPGPIPSGQVLRPVTADMNMQYLNLNLVIKPPTKRRTKPYAIAGIGAYYRPVKITTPTAGYVPSYCYPYYYTCWPGGTVVMDQVLASAEATNFGIDVGGGVYVLMDKSAGGGFYVESRFHYIWGPEVKDSSGVSYGKANGQFLPITIGLRF
jgi:hypothetical protein